MGTPERASLLQQVAEITVDEYRAACLIVTDDEGRMLVDLFKMGQHHSASKIDDATRQLLVNLLHDQAVADNQAAGQDRLVETILGTDREITELKGQLQTVTTERDDLQSRLEGLTRDHDAAKTKNEELTNKLAEIQNHSLSRAREEVQKLKNEMSDFHKAKDENDAVAASKFLEFAELRRKARQQELDIVVLEESYTSLQQSLEQARQQGSQIQLDLNEMREQAHDNRTEAEQAWAEVTRLEQERTTMQQLAEEIQQSNTALTGQNQEQLLAIHSLEQDTQHFIRIMGSLTGVQLDPDSWNTAVRLVGTPVHGLDELTPFWRVDQSWGETRSMSEYRPSQNSSEMLTSCFSLFATLVTSSDEVDWRNRAVQVTQCLMRELQGAEEAQIYVGFLEEFANLVARLIDQGRLQDNDPLVFSIWELLACANEMLTGMLGQPTNLLEQRLGGRWRALSRAMRAGYTHVTEEAISTLFRESEYLRAPGMGVLLDDERLTGARLYIVLDFNPNARALRVMEGRIWSLVAEGGNFGAVCFRGSDDLTVTIPLAGPGDIMWWWNSVDNMEVD
ncbi:uncharacterized protein B0T23DRAFT_398085 [Neurospora hispaniola]|uniref:Uncharacterized protein n=1 Tax=Neurospora hispaniola TaxID=588809 RepID=A0AAJ0I4S6_9PEZI|nr:hypothetical protein B0T23DRAFT_398085 [Neurospora hispaniola]